tara:strand:- start:2317 stop:3765 length:1449 start_codon:yes stop_codon:yes gene_type:complete
MAKKLSASESKQILGIEGDNTRNGQIRADEFLPTLRGRRAMRKYREMRDNDSTVGAVMYATEQMLRDVPMNIIPADDSEAAEEGVTFLNSVFEDMDHTLDDHIAEALSYLTYGFSWFEVVYKKREGPNASSLAKRSKYSDGYMGVRKIATRAPWTVSRFEVDEKTGDLLGVYQSEGYSLGRDYIPLRKSLYYRTTAINGDVSGRSVLRNAYTAYERLKEIQQYEAIGIERELAGIPVISVPSSYFDPDATEAQQAALEKFKKIGRDLKFNEQGYILKPSDTYPGKEGEPSNIPLVSFELLSSGGTRAIEIDPVVKRYQHDIARSILAEFIMLGSSEKGSYALSKSKTDLYLRALESYIQMIADVLNKQLVQTLWELNGFPLETMPKIKAGDVAPHDLKELGSYLRNLNGADINLSGQPDIVDALLLNAELPPLNREEYSVDLEATRAANLARADYYDDDNVPGSGGSSEEDTEEDTEEEDDK